MSAFVVDKSDIDRLVRAALYAHQSHYPGDRRQMQWWRVDEQGDYAGWNKLYELAETRAGDDYMQYVTPSYLGQILVSENVASVAYRYEDCTPDAGDLPGPCDAYYMGPYVYSDPREDLTPGAVFELIDRLDYQSCEHPGWRTSEAHAFCVALRKAYCDRVIYAESAAQCREP
jgi:hypothetical protein